MFYRCQCRQCNTEQLLSALEYECCWEVLQAHQQLVFDGSTERIKCVTQHKSYLSISDTAVLTRVGPLLHDKNGKHIAAMLGSPIASKFKVIAVEFVHHHSFLSCYTTFFRLSVQFWQQNNGRIEHRLAPD